jgi:hypothetical protein
MERPKDMDWETYRRGYRMWHGEDPPTANPEAEAEKVSPFPLEPDLKAAEQFLKALDPSTLRFTFQTFDDVEVIEGDRVKKRERPELVRILHGTLEEHAPELTRLNRLGAGVYITVNATNLQGRKDKDIVRMRDVWREDDDGVREKLPLPLDPHYVVESSPGKFHEHVFVQGMTADEHRGVIETMVTRFGSCSGAKGLNRVLRLPGYFHTKGSPFQVRIVGGTALKPGWKPYTAEQVLAAFPPPPPRPEQAPRDYAPDVSLEHVADALRYVTKVDDRETWLTVGQALHDVDTLEARELWDTWSQQSAKYDADDQERVWESFDHHRDGKRVTVGSIFWLAGKGGWIAPADFRGDPASGFGPIPDANYTIGAEAKAEAKAPTGKLIKHTDEIDRDAITRHQSNALLKGVLYPGDFGVLWGDPGDGKTFTALDIAWRIVRGEEFHGRKTKQAPVLYCTFEGKAGFEKRLWAAESTHGDPGKFFATLNVTVTLCKTENGKQGAATIVAAYGQLEAGVKAERRGLIIIDTWARSTAGDNENAIEDAMLFVEQRVGHIQRETGAAVLVLHHSNRSGDVRGNLSAVRGSPDVIIVARRDDDDRALRSLYVDKCKDGEEGLLLEYKLRVVHLGTDADGDAITSCVVERIDPAPRTQRDLDCQAQFVALVTKAYGDGVRLSPGTQARNYAPSWCVRNQGPTDFTREEFERALSDSASAFRIEERRVRGKGPRHKPTQVLVPIPAKMPNAGGLGPL